MKSRKKRGGPNRTLFSSSGFSLVEVVIAASLLGLVISISATMFSISNRSTRQSGTAANTLAAIDTDISKIKEVAETLTCCPGSCTTNQTTINTAKTNGKCANPSNPGDSSYYFPLQSADVTTFSNACNATTAANDSISQSFISSINALPLPSGISNRAATIDEISTHRVTVSYSGSTGAGGSFANRTIKIVPTVANWCP